MRSRLAKVAVAVPLGMATATAIVVAGCGSTCDTAVSVAPVVIQGGGRPSADLDLSARVTAGGRPVPDLRIEFRTGWPPDRGLLMGTEETDSDGVARLHVTDAVGPGSENGPQSVEWTRYQAEVSLVQTSKEASDAVCVRNGQASFRYEP